MAGPSEWSLPNREVSLIRLSPRTLGKKQAWLPWKGSGQDSPGQTMDGNQPLEVGRPPLFGIGFDMCFQTWLQS